MRNKNTQLISSQEWFTTTESATSIWRWMGGEPSRYTAELMSRWKAAVQSGKVRWMSRNRGGGGERERESQVGATPTTHTLPHRPGKQLEAQPGRDRVQVVYKCALLLQAWFLTLKSSNLWSPFQTDTDITWGNLLELTQPRLEPQKSYSATPVTLWCVRLLKFILNRPGRVSQPTLGQPFWTCFSHNCPLFMWDSPKSHASWHPDKTLACQKCFSFYWSVMCFRQNFITLYSDSENGSPPQIWRIAEAIEAFVSFFVTMKWNQSMWWLIVLEPIFKQPPLPLSVRSIFLPRYQ